MASPKFQALRGTRDILSPESERQRALVDVFADLAGRAGYGHIMSPIFEDLGVFLRVGESTDVVTKEMYDFEDEDGKRIALRPELTASVVRAFVQHNPANLPWKTWYEGPQFRHERPQAGRERQFSQGGIEVLGSNDADIDIEVIALGWRFYQALGMTQITLLLNSLGDDDCRPQYLAALAEYFESRRNELTEAAQETLAKNPLRVLDSKREPDQAVIAEAPLMVDHLTAETAEQGRIEQRLDESHDAGFERVASGLDAKARLFEEPPARFRSDQRRELLGFWFHDVHGWDVAVRGRRILIQESGQ